MPSKDKADFQVGEQLLRDITELAEEGPYWSRAAALREAVRELVARQRPPAEIRDSEARALASKVHALYEALATDLQRQKMGHLIPMLRQAMALAPEDFWQSDSKDPAAD